MKYKKVYSAAIYQLLQAMCKTEQAKQVSVAKGGSGIVRILFIPTAVAEGGFLRQGYLLWLFCG